MDHYKSLILKLHLYILNINPLSRSFKTRRQRQNEAGANKKGYDLYVEVIRAKYI